MKPQVSRRTGGRPQVSEVAVKFAEDYHQQYLYKVPNGYCPDHGTGVSCPIGLNLR